MHCNLLLLANESLEEELWQMQPQQTKKPQ
jgi:hypothetical protein